MEARIAIALTFAVLAVVVWLAGSILKGRVSGQFRDLVGQLIPVLVFAIVVVGILVVIDPDQADRLLSSLISSVPRVLVAIIVTIIARALGRIGGMLVETALRRVSALMAVRARMLVSTTVMAIGVIIALQQVGVSTDIILILVAALAFGVALALALGIGIGSVPLARQVAAGRHVAARYAPGDSVQVGEVQGQITEIGLATTRLATADGYVDVPNAEFIAEAVIVRG